MENKLCEKKVKVKENKKRKGEMERWSTLCTIFATSCESTVTSKSKVKKRFPDVPPWFRRHSRWVRVQLVPVSELGDIGEGGGKISLGSEFC